MKAVLGLDIGNGTIKFALLDARAKLIDSIYTKNFGVIETLRDGLRKLKQRHGNVEIMAVGITGAGRELGSAFIGADVAKTEILAHAVAAQHFMPKVQTVFDLGQEDSKILILRNGVLVDFAMNQICSGGCGAYLENVAFRLGLKVEQFDKLALRSKSPSLIPGKCAVFGTTSCVHKLNAGIAKEEILMGVAQSLVRNYLALLAKGKELKPPFLFQGGVSLNKAVVKALEKELSCRVIVPKHAPIMGAIGAAILALENKPQQTAFKGFKLADFKYQTTSFVCHRCQNNCEITNIIREGKKIASIGSRCGRYNIDFSKT